MSYSYDEDEFINTANEIYEFLTDKKTISDKPTAILTGGQPGSGKTTLQKIALENDSNIIVINGDEFRKYHPRYKDIIKKEPDYIPITQKFSNRMVEYLITKLSDEKYNLLIEGTLRTTSVPLKTKAQLRKKGYRLELHVMAVPKDLSWQGTINRYNSMLEIGVDARKTSKESHDFVVEHIAENLNYLYLNGNFDNIKLFNRERECLYDSEKDNISPETLLNKILNYRTELEPELLRNKRLRR